MYKLLESIYFIPHYRLDIFGLRSPNTLPNGHTYENKGPKLLKWVIYMNFHSSG
jgi:hypothetical protein